MNKSFSTPERRKYVRIQKNFLMSYFPKDLPAEKYELTQLKNISMGGACFITTRRFDAGTEIGIELKTPYLTDTTYIEAVILDSRTKVTNMIYETRVKFNFLDPKAEFVMAKLIEVFVKGDPGSE